MTTRLKIAEERLEKALVRVDAAVASNGAKKEADPNVAGIQAQNTALRDQQQNLANRLDSAIAHLRHVLEE
jgi:hypothetical protein